MFGFLINGRRDFRFKIMMDVFKLYPQYRVPQDRRQQNIQIPTDRRSGFDRRSDDRVKLNGNLTKDIFVVKSSLSQLQNSEKNHSNKMLIKALDSTSFGRKVLSALQSVNNQEMNKETGKTRLLDNLKNNSKIQSTTTVAAGALIGIFAAVMTSLFANTAAAIVSLGVGFYFGSKFVKNVIATHLKKD